MVREPVASVKRSAVLQADSEAPASSRGYGSFPLYASSAAAASRGI